MKKILVRLSILLLMLFSSLETIKALEPTFSSHKESYSAISLWDLDIEGEDLILNLEGMSRPVSSLEKLNGQWVATTYNTRYCPRGHPLCNCGNCHVEGCPYYVDPGKIHK